MALGSVLEYERLLIYIEGMEFFAITNNCCFEVILALLASFYVFNIDYINTKSVLCFLYTTCIISSKFKYGC